MEHHVYFWLKEENKNPEDRAEFEQGLASLLAIPEAVSGIWSVPAAVELRPVVDQSWDYALSIRFASLEDHNIYQDDADHLAFIQKFRDMWAKVLVSDLA